MTAPAAVRAGDGSGEPVLAEVDLDIAPPAEPPRRRPLATGAILAATIGLVAGAALHAQLTGPPATPATPVTAWVTLGSVTPAVGGAPPTADLLVTVADHGGTDRTVTAIDVRGPRAGSPPGRAGSPPTSLPVDLPAGSSRTVTVRQPLACDPASPSRPTDPPDAGLEVRVTLPGAGAPLVAVPVGLLSEPDGVCRALAASSPAGAGDPLPVTSARFSDRAASVTVILPAGGRVVGVAADGWAVPVPRSRPDGAGTALTLAAPPGCPQPWSRGVVPVGLQVQVEAAGGRSTRYAAVGPDLARWLLAARSQACRSRPATGP